MESAQVRQDMRFGVIRDSSEMEKKVYELDQKTCHVCHWPTEIPVDDPYRRYCTNLKCQAFILEQKEQSSDN